MKVNWDITSAVMRLRKHGRGSYFFDELGYVTVTACDIITITPWGLPEK